MRLKLRKFANPATVADILFSVAVAIAITDMVRHPQADYDDRG